MKVKSFSGARLLETPWTAAQQAPLSMGFSRQEYWSGVPLPSPGQHGGPKKEEYDFKKYLCKDAQDLQHLNVFSENKLNNLKINLMARIRKDLA